MLPVAIGTEPLTGGTTHSTPVKVKAHALESDIYPPFDIPYDDLDIVLCSSDSVYFHVLKIFLSIASPFFRDMFTLPQPEDDLVTCNVSLDGSRDGRPVIHVTESSATLKNLLALCYPAWMLNPPFAQLSDVQAVLEAATKYDMAGVVRSVGRALVTQRFLEQDPLRVFVIACRYALTIEAAVAARHTLKIPVSSWSYFGDLEHITGGTFQRLIDYHFKCSRIAQRVTTEGNYGWITHDDFAWFRYKCLTCSFGSRPVTIGGNLVQSTAGYWIKYMHEVGDALAQSPCVATVMRTDLLHNALAQAHICKTCASNKTKVADDFEIFRGLLAKEVERVLSSVTLVLKL